MNDSEIFAYVVLHTDKENQVKSSVDLLAELSEDVNKITVSTDESDILLQEIRTIIHFIFIETSSFLYRCTFADLKKKKKRDVQASPLCVASSPIIPLIHDLPSSPQQPGGDREKVVSPLGFSPEEPTCPR